MAAVGTNPVKAALVIKHGEDPVTLWSTCSVKGNFFTGNAQSDIVLEAARLVASQQEPGSMKRVQLPENTGSVFVYITPEGLGSVVVTDIEYDSRIGANLTTMIMEAFLEKYKDIWRTARTSNSFSLPEGENLFNDAQCPEKFDKLAELEGKVDHLKGLLVELIETSADRGDRLDALLIQSNNLSESAKKFYKHARKQNQCCKYM